MLIPLDTHYLWIKTSPTSRSHSGWSRQAGVADDATPMVSRPRKIVVSDDENGVFLGKEEVGEALVCEKTVLLGCKNNQATCPKLGGETSIVFLCSPGYLRK